MTVMDSLIFEIHIQKIYVYDSDTQDEIQIHHGKRLQIMHKYLKDCGIHIQTLDISNRFFGGGGGIYF